MNPKDENHSEHRIAICIDNADYELSIERRKVYCVVPDQEAEKDNYIRIIDETGEDYLFPVNRFVVLSVPIEIEEAVLAKV